MTFAGSRSGSNSYRALCSLASTGQEVRSLRSLSLDSAHRRRGVATTLLSTVVHYASSLGASHVCAEASNVNAPAIAPYLRNGFGLVGLDTSLYAATSHADEVAVYLALRL